jgi:hypothetical protein
MLIELQVSGHHFCVRECLYPSTEFSVVGLGQWYCLLSLGSPTYKPHSQFHTLTERLVKLISQSGCLLDDNC